MPRRSPSLRYLPYDDTLSVPNVVVDGSPNASTVLTLSHWPGVDAPDHLRRDLSAEMAFAYLDAGEPASGAAVVTNNHFDQDGLVSVFALVHPERAAEHRELLVDLARAGDFGTFHDRRAARAAMVVDDWSARGLGYAHGLARVLDLVLDPEPYREVWAAEDAALDRSVADLAAGRIVIEERSDLDLAIVRVPEALAAPHPMAVHNVTDRFRILTVHGAEVRHTDRYETWVRFQSRPTLGRVDLRPVAAQLTAADEVSWTAGSPDDMTPTLAADRIGRLDPDARIAVICAALAGLAKDSGPHSD